MVKVYGRSGQLQSQTARAEWEKGDSDTYRFRKKMANDSGYEWRVVRPFQTSDGVRFEP